MQNPDTDVEFQILTTMRSFFGQGGPARMQHTLLPCVYAALALIPKIFRREQMVAEGIEGVTPAQIQIKKVFQFMHKTITAVKEHAPESGLTLWLQAATAADEVDKMYGSQGHMENICYEFFTQGLLTFEEDISETQKQFKAIFKIVGCLTRITCLSQENFDNCATKMTQHSARLLKKPLQCRAIAVCSHLFYCHARQDGKKVLECLQKCLKITDNIAQNDTKSVGLWVEMLDKYLYYFEIGTPEVPAKNISGLMDLCKEHISYAQDGGVDAEAKAAQLHFEKTQNYIQQKIAEGDARFAEITS